MQLRTKIFLIFLGVSLAIIGVVVIYLQFFVKKSFVTLATESIQATTQSNEILYRIFTEDLKTRAKSWSSDRYIKTLAQNILTAQDKGKKYDATVKEFSRYLREEKMKNDPRVIIVDLLDKNGAVVSSSREDRIGKNEYEEEREHGAHYFSKTLTASFGESFLMGAVLEEDESADSMFHVTTRMFSTAVLPDGTFVPLDGVFLVHFVLAQDLSTLLAHSGKFAPYDELESSISHVQTYIVNGDHLLVASSHPIQPEHLGVRGLSPLIDSCFQGKATQEAVFYTNHDGIRVLGSSACLAQDGLVLLSEIPESDVFGVYRNLLLDTIIIGASAFFFIAILVLFIFRRSVGVMEVVANLARRVSQGDFSARVPVTRTDEIGVIAQAFNTILDTATTLQENLKRSNTKLAEEAEQLAQSLEKHQDQEHFLNESKRATLNLLEDTWKVKEGLEIKERRLQAILGAIPAAVFLIDRQYRIEMVNQRAEKFTGFSHKELFGKDFRSFVTIWRNQKEKLSNGDSPIENTFLTNSVWATGLEDGLSITTERRQLHLPVTVSATPLREDIHTQNTKAVVVIRDMTRDRELDEARSGFISIASHQLRTPLTTIRWYSEMLLDEDVGSLSDTQRDFLKEINAGTERLYKTIDLLLGISRVQNGKQKAEPKEIDLTVFTQEIVKELTPQANAKNLVFSMIPPDGEALVVFLDPLRLRQVVSNLISNAIRYTNQNGTIEVLWNQSTTLPEIVYSVRDNGIGIPEGEQKHIFSKFFRAENAVAQVPDGSGLGLALVKELVEGWGGSISFKTKEGEGTTFTFSIPKVSSEEKLPLVETPKGVTIKQS